MIIKNTKENEKFLLEICSEHYELTKNSDSNINYLWYLYFQGTKTGDYAPFIFFAEINLNYTLGIIDEKEKERMYKLLESEDEDNFYIVSLALKHLRKERHNKFGANTNAPAYDVVKKDYSFTVLSHDLFMKIVKK